MWGSGERRGSGEGAADTREVAETLAAQVGVPSVDSSRGLKLVWATGAGAELRQTLGTAVFAGMIGVTLFGLIFTLSLLRDLSLACWPPRSAEKSEAQSGAR